MNQNEKERVMRMSREGFQGARGEPFINDYFAGSLPMSLTAFSCRKKLNEGKLRML